MGSCLRPRCDREAEVRLDHRLQVTLAGRNLADLAATRRCDSEIVNSRLAAHLVALPEQTGSLGNCRQANPFDARTTGVTRHCILENGAASARDNLGRQCGPARIADRPNSSRRSPRSVGRPTDTAAASRAALLGHAMNTVRPSGHRQASVDPIQIDATEPPRAVTSTPMKQPTAR
jgi:hypothetical protein